MMAEHNFEGGVFDACGNCRWNQRDFKEGRAQDPSRVRPDATSKYCPGRPAAFWRPQSMMPGSENLPCIHDVARGLREHHCPICGKTLIYVPEAEFEKAKAKIESVNEALRALWVPIAFVSLPRFVRAHNEPFRALDDDEIKRVKNLADVHEYVEWWDIGSLVKTIEAAKVIELSDCIRCNCITINAASDKCSCGGELSPIHKHVSSGYQILGTHLGAVAKPNKPG